VYRDGARLRWQPVGPMNHLIGAPQALGRGGISVVEFRKRFRRSDQPVPTALERDIRQAGYRF
jgi:hypothetical protein